MTTNFFKVRIMSSYHDQFHCTYFPANKCESAWILFGDSCYFFALNAKSKDAAENDCIGKDSHLASIHSNEESEFVWSQTINKDMWWWIGGEKKENSFQWLDGTKFEYTNWDSNSLQPDNLDGKENCIKLINSLGSWHDASCEFIHTYVCKKPALGNCFSL